MRKFLLIAGLSTLIIFTGKKANPFEPVKKSIHQIESEANQKKVLFIIAHRNFQDEEYAKPRKILEDAGFQVIVASSDTSIAKGMWKTEVKPDFLLSERIKIDDYSAVVFIGGSGSNEYWENPQAHKIARAAQEKDKVIGAICIAPVTLAKAGLLKGKKATVWSSCAKELKRCGAKYTKEDLQVDGKIVTASGPKVAEKFGEAILKLLLKK
ncbi:MAG: DJ-1/PfpI family protein [Candidatus Edwardsbacteria bacterium]